ncbi:MAG: Eco57I restriction-modification methylase domain-containing protein [Bacteroidetes bacterium]|nr:Eco57I restriction-modification methylase domain-containing protein [Bacteroidota bacterium]
MFTTIDAIKQKATGQLDQSKRSSLGQFMTPAIVAKFIASMFKTVNSDNVHILDAGAGVGSLTAALLERFIQEKRKNSIEVTAYEIDPVLTRYLTENLAYYKSSFSKNGIPFKSHLITGDFIADTTSGESEGFPGCYTHAILNPPYKKINSESMHRIQLRSVGIETVNLYSAFVAISLMLLKDQGELVAIIPRSFCNGNYYKPFRELIIGNSAIQRIHLFDSRSQAFKEDSVLQENIIIHLIKGAKQGKVVISQSADESLHDLTLNSYSYSQIVKPRDQEFFIHIPNGEKNHLENSKSITYTLSELSLEVSTGPVVDFRSKEYISKEPLEGYVPLLYPTHFNGKEIQWPKEGKKPNAIALLQETQKMLYPKGFYTIVKRFSSKEEKQRIVARVINPRKLDFGYIGIENHLNVFHSGKAGIPEDLAFGLAAYLNSSFVDTHFRSFNGHTQVNATDLKQMKYPSRDVLIQLGKWAKGLKDFEQSVLDDRIKKLL